VRLNTLISIAIKNFQKGGFSMPYISPEVIQEAKQMDLLTYLQNYESQELVRFSGNVYCTRAHDSLKISNGRCVKRISSAVKIYFINFTIQPAATAHFFDLTFWHPTFPKRTPYDTEQTAEHAPKPKPHNVCKRRSAPPFWLLQLGFCTRR
jgi:hypothetical protein